MDLKEKVNTMKKVECNNNMVRVEAVSVSYDKKKNVLEDLDLEVNAGEFLSILGPNGSGKTTLLKCINRIIKYENGKIIICGKDIEDFSRTELSRRVSMLNQLPVIEFPFRIRELLTMGAYPYTGFFEDFPEVSGSNEIIKMVGVEKLLDRYIFEISAGEYQLVMLALTLIQDTPVITLDEPTAHLDLYFQRKIMEVLKSVNEEKYTTVIFVSHDVNLASRFSDRIAFLHKGKIAKIGKPADVLNKDIIKLVYDYEARLITDGEYDFPVII